MSHRSLVVAVVAGTLGLASTQAQTCPTPSTLASSLVGAAQASVLSLSGVDPTQCPEIGMSNTWTGGRLIFSDSPEYAPAPGILYQDGGMPATSGSNYHRVFLYHVNGNSAEHMKFAVILTNLGSSSGTLTVEQTGTAGPSTSYLYVGKLAFDRWLSSTAKSAVSVGAGASVELDPTFDGLSAAYNYLLNGIWDSSFTQPHEITVCALHPTDDPVSVCPTLALLAKDGSHQRGTFPNDNKIYNAGSGVTIDTAGGMQQFPLAANSPNDPDAVGVDATDGSSVTLSGNYGILYRIHLSTKSSNGKNLAFLLNPRGGTWAGAANAEAGITPGGVFLIPPSSGSVSSNTYAALEGEYSPGSAFTVWLQFMPTGAASLPLRFVATPF